MHNTYGMGTVTYMDKDHVTIIFDKEGKKEISTDYFLKSTEFENYSYSAPTKIKLSQIIVKGLFDRFNYEIDIDIRNNASILIAPNGCGKTTIFKFISFLFKPTIGKFKDIKDIPFTKFSCILSNGKSVLLKRIRLDTGSKKKNNAYSKHYNSAMSINSVPYEFTIEILENEKTVDRFRLTKAISKMQSDRIFVEYDDEGYIYETRRNYEQADSLLYDIINFLRKHHCNASVDFIEANRLQRIYDSRNKVISGSISQKGFGRLQEKRTEKIDYLTYANEEMTANINIWLQEYNRRLADAKNKLPLWYIESADFSYGIDYPSFKKRWNQYYKELNKFYEIGLLDAPKAVIEPDELEEAYYKKTSFLVTYLDVFESTLEPLQANYDKIRLFSSIFNKRNEITGKTIKFTSEGIKVFSYGKEINIEYLSSGEKNDFIMFYRLIFNTPRYGIVLIDEPEISLHIEWQEEYLDWLIDICKMNDLQAIVATHSPNIVNGHLDLFVEKRENHGD